MMITFKVMLNSTHDSFKWALESTCTIRILTVMDFNLTCKDIDFVSGRFYLILMVRKEQVLKLMCHSNMRYCVES